jgi:hypothetical protein
MKLFVLVILVSHSLLSFCQNESFTIDARIDRTSDGNLYITANNPRPLRQTIEGLRYRYGWTVDYEDPFYPPQLIKFTSDKHGYPIGGEFRVNVREPKDSSASEEQRILEDVVQQYNQQSSLKFKVIKLSNIRYEVVPAKGALLDRMIRIDSTTRSLRSEIDAISDALASASGIKVVQGGLIDTYMENTTVSLRHDGPVPARDLIREVLNHSSGQKVVTLEYDPNGSFYAIGVQPTVEWVPREDGKIAEKQFDNPDFIPQER